MRFLFIFFSSTLMLACGAPEPTLFDAKVSKLFHSDPKQDAAAAIANKDFRFLAIHNHDLKMPINIDACVLEKYGYRVLSNESLKYMSYDISNVRRDFYHLRQLV